MSTNRSSRAARVLAICSVVVAVAGCTSDAGDKAGGPGEPVVLTMANGYADLNYEPAVKDFVARIAERSGGALRIDVVGGWGDFAPDFEQQIVRDVAAGEADLGWVGTRIFDTLGVKSFQALTAPMLIDSYALQRAVIDSGISDQMLKGLESLDVIGLAVLADGLRKPIAVQQPLLGPADWRGLTVQAFRSEGHAAAIRALGATPTDVAFDALDVAIDNGTVQGFEKSLLIYQINVLAGRAPHVTANVNLWPQTVALLANPDRLGDLTDDQRGWLRQAAEDAATRSTDLVNQDASLVSQVCESGARFATASGSDIEALRRAFEPVYAHLVQDAQTKAFIDDIERLKGATPSDPALVVPPNCTGAAAAAPSGAPGPAAGDLHGTYRWTLTDEDAQKYGTASDKTAEALATAYPSTFTVELRDGNWSMRQTADPAVYGGTYTVTAGQITFQWPAEGAALSFTYSVDGKGNLDLAAVESTEPGDRFVWSTHPWTKIG